MVIKHIKQKLVIGTIIIALIAVTITVFIQQKSDAPSPAQQNNPGSDNKTIAHDQSQPTENSFNKQLYSLEDPASLWVVVNKKRSLPSTYVPTDLAAVSSGEQMRAAAAEQVKVLMADATKQGVNLKAISGYRSYTKQQGLYSAYVSKDGHAAADTYSARAGHSEHQSGLAIDLGNINGSCDLEECFANTPGGVWIAQHAHEYGFTIRYASDKTAITGYQYEPWHIRYVGKELAAELHSKKQTMEEFFGLPAAPGY